MSKAGHERFEKLANQTKDLVLGRDKSHVRPEKGDLEAWKPGVTFHYIKD